MTLSVLLWSWISGTSLAVVVEDDGDDALKEGIGGVLQRFRIRLFQSGRG